MAGRMAVEPLFFKRSMHTAAKLNDVEKPVQFVPPSAPAGRVEPLPKRLCIDRATVTGCPFEYFPVLRAGYWRLLQLAHQGFEQGKRPGMRVRRQHPDQGRAGL